MTKSRYDRTPKKVYFHVDANWIIELDSIDAIIEKLEELKQQDGVFTDIFITGDSEDYDYGIEAHFYRYESQEEADRRVDSLIERDKAEAKRKKEKELKEKAAARAEIDRLRKKYNI